MTQFCDKKGQACDFDTWYACLTESDKLNVIEEVVVDGIGFMLWTRFKGLNGEVYQTTTQLKDDIAFNKDNDIHDKYHKVKLVEAQSDAATEHASIKEKMLAKDDIKPVVAAEV